MDTSSRRALTSVLASASGSRVLFLITTRESRELMRTLRHSSNATMLQLRPLAEPAVRAVVERSLDAYGSSASKHIQDRIVECSGGNPLFALLLAASCHESGDRFVVPSDLFASLRRRIDGLSHREAAVLATCVALGRHASPARLAACLDMPQIDVLETVGGLCDRGILGESDATIQTAHPLIGEIADEHIPLAVRRLTANRVADLLSSQADRTNLSSLRWDAAECYLSAGENDAAFASFRQCADHALAIGQAGDAAITLKRACSLGTSGPELIEALQDLIRAADAAFEVDLVIEAGARLEDLGCASEHNDIELAQITDVARMVAHRP